MTTEDVRRAVNAMIGYEAVKEGEEIEGYSSCMWCRRIMPIVSRSVGSFKKSGCAGCNAST